MMAESMEWKFLNWTDKNSYGNSKDKECVVLLFMWK